MSGLQGRRVAVLERHHPPGHEGALVEPLVRALRARGALVGVISVAEEPLRLDVAPPWDLAVLKSGEAVALHAAAAAAAWGVPVVNAAEATRLAQDRIAVAFILRAAGLPIPAVRAIQVAAAKAAEPTRDWSRRPIVIKSRRGSGGAGLWRIGPGDASVGPVVVPPGAYLVMDHVAHEGDDLKVYVADGWLAAIKRRFPAGTLTEKRGRRVPVPEEAARTALAVGRLLGLRFYGCDFVRARRGWMLVDVNAFPGYKGVDEAADRIAQALDRDPVAALTTACATRGDP